ncbi:MAG: exo-alpha-sialidase [Acidobacteria bacterium]|nr:exo-alpha-sialidase [Acidobacteriota bacterium]
MPMRLIVAAVAAAVVLAAAASCGRREPAQWTVTVQRVASPAGPDTSEPQIVDAGRGRILSWVERAGKTSHLKFAERSGDGWSAPVTAASGDDWFLSYADVPSVIRLGDGTLVAQWLQQVDPVTEAYNLRLSSSKDNGKTWGASFMPHHDGTKTQHGFASLVDMPGNTLGVVWLDGRNSEVLDKDPASGTMTLRYAAFDAAGTQTSDTEIDHRVCECCPTTAVATADGLLTAFRDRSDDEIRDIAVSRLDGGKWTTAAAVSRDNWKIDFCPVNGPMLSARGRDVAAAWFTVKNDQGQAYAAFSSDAGRTWGMPIRLDDGGSLGRVDVELLDDGSAVASWVEYAEGRSDFRIRRVERSGARSAPIGVAAVSGGQASGYPRIGRVGNELIFAWSGSGTEGGELQVQTAVAQLP